VLALGAIFTTPVSVPAVTSCTGTALFTTYLTWFDNASAGMVADNIHILNTGASASSGCVTVGGGQGVAWSAGPGLETYVTFPRGTIGGPVRVTVTSGPAVQASHRVQFYSSFNELPAASAASAVTTSYFNWYDKAGPGMYNDNIHLLNPGTVDATVTVTLPGASPQTKTVAAGTQGYVNFPQGSGGGPVTVSSTQPVLASQRVQFYQSFSELWAASSTQAATKSYFTWFDSTSPGVAYDNIHLFNPGTVTANVSVSLPRSFAATTSINPGGEAFVTIPPGVVGAHCAPTNCAPPQGGPLTVSSDQPVLASQRVQFYSSFNEIWSATAAQAATTAYFNWYDKASAGMYNDNVHLVNTGTVDATATVSVTGVGSQTVIVSAGSYNYVNFAGSIGGPVKVTSDQPLLASQRVQYYQSFNEVWAG
jgi:hypothetical protein